MDSHTQLQAFPPGSEVLRSTSEVSMLPHPLPGVVPEPPQHPFLSTIHPSCPRAEWLVGGLLPHITGICWATQPAAPASSAPSTNPFASRRVRGRTGCVSVLRPRRFLHWSRQASSTSRSPRRYSCCCCCCCSLFNRACLGGLPGCFLVAERQS